ncbi:MAG: hypothetical protein Q8N51_19700, partial [Gammaproteobacteria bacterium]|nr:hypothetical protein [Gammaproteobacteria bacterium]
GGKRMSSALQTMFSRAFAVTWLFAGLVDSASSADSPNPAHMFGAHTVGSSLADVRQYRTSENCIIEKDNADCSFIDLNGVRYVVLDKSVIAVVAQTESASSKLGLPYGLKFGDSLEAAIRKLVSVGDDPWLVGTDHEGGVAVSSYKQYSGKNGVKFNVGLQFTKDKLVEVKYNSGTI